MFFLRISYLKTSPKNREKTRGMILNTKGEKTMSNKKGSAPPRYDEEFKKGAMCALPEKTDKKRRQKAE